MLADGPSARFARRHGCTLEQVERYSVLAVPSDEAGLAALEAHRADAAQAAGDDYHLHVWHDTVPTEWLGALAALMARMNTDAPSGAVEIDAELWDAERVRTSREHSAHQQLHLTITAAEHVPAGTLVACTMLQHPVADVPFAFQEDTLVHMLAITVGLGFRAAGVQAVWHKVR
ncbi:hypothetical protein [Cellulomonas hominis]